MDQGFEDEFADELEILNEGSSSGNNSCPNPGWSNGPGPLFKRTLTLDSPPTSSKRPLDESPLPSSEPHEREFITYRVDHICMVSHLMVSCRSQKTSLYKEWEWPPS